ncbi:MAG: diacylglycerol kinase family protein [Clostridiales bacterium]|nr:diacylglycerol kinase family protein [Clostridiales bacterium]
MKAFLRSFSYAGRGIWFCIRHERNFRFHMVAAIYVLAFAPLFSLTRGEWAALLATIGVVLTAEAVNTAIEQTVNRISIERHPYARAAKDAAAGAVLLCCLLSLGVAAALFWRPEVWNAILHDWQADWWKPGLLLLSLPCAVWFIGGQGSPHPAEDSLPDAPKQP